MLLEGVEKQNDEEPTEGNEADDGRLDEDEGGRGGYGCRSHGNCRFQRSSRRNLDARRKGAGIRRQGSVRRLTSTADDWSGYAFDSAVRSAILPRFTITMTA